LEPARAHSDWRRDTVTFARTRSPGQWFTGYVPVSSDFEDIDDKTSKAIDGFAGGAYAPTGLITIGGSGLTATGPFAASGTASFSGPLSSGGVSTFTGTVALNGNASLASGKTFTVSGALALAGTMNGAGAVNLSGVTTLAELHLSSSDPVLGNVQYATRTT